MEPTVAEILDRYVDLVAGSPHNLVSRRARDELGTRHVPEAVRFAATLPGPGRVLDLGSGGGLPGLVIAIVRPDLEVHLLEATGKKARFLEEAASALATPVTVHHGRAEELARGPLRGSFPVVTARAVAPLDRLVTIAEPFLAVGGALHALKGGRWQEELEAARAVIVAAGLRVAATPSEAPPAVGHRAGEEPLRVVVLERP